ncbi:MAG: hypothetical protein IJ097_03610 [Bacilli bacterium]|nr:hypothetical protein [Bacilli bacterium]
MKKNQDIVYNDCWIFILLLTTLVILTESMKVYTFNIFEIDLTYALFLLPFSYFIVNYIAKKYDYKKAIAAIAISGVIFVSFTCIISYLVSNNLMLDSIAGELCAYVVSQFINLTIYMFLLNNTPSLFVLVLFNYLFALVVYYMIYTLLYLNMVVGDTYWIGYFITLIIQFILCIIITIIDKKIKRGQ